MDATPRTCAQPTTGGYPCPLTLPPAGRCSSPLHTSAAASGRTQAQPARRTHQPQPPTLDELVATARRHRIRLATRNITDTTHNRQILAAAIDQLTIAIDEHDLHRRRSAIRVRHLDVVDHTTAALANLRIHHRNDMRATVGAGRRLAAAVRYRLERRRLRRDHLRGDATIPMAEAEARPRRLSRRATVTLRLTYDPAHGRIHDGYAPEDRHRDIAVHDLDSLLVHEMAHIHDFAALPAFTAKQRRRWRRAFEQALTAAYGRRATKAGAAPTRYAKHDPREFVAEIAVLLADPTRTVRLHGQDTHQQAVAFARAYNRAAGRTVIHHAS